ncbi:hypothetical protein NG831_12950 [Xanthomonas sacchari]|uniref:hypothetical protein n=1 Tax=Xanthomonas TaxID=338 RepID=UPI0012631193|nr:MULTISPECIES: hypothetical protein [Xanthomonas]UYK65141.1 hypothetical protein NG831_12950 [Xanthomonas sacchari]
MSENIDVNAFMEKNGSIEPFLLKISEPIPLGEDDFYCVVHMPGVLTEDKKILGIDATQASELAANFARSMLGDAKIVDGNGVAINW